MKISFLYTIYNLKIKKNSKLSSNIKTKKNEENHFVTSLFQMKSLIIHNIFINYIKVKKKSERILLLITLNRKRIIIDYFMENSKQFIVK